MIESVWFRMGNSTSAVARSEGFAPIAAPNASLLILGTLPSQRSLEVGEYYAHPRNAFWRIMGELFDACGDYSQRCGVLCERGIAVWDVLAAAVRPGSLDAAIRPATAKPNDFPAFFRAHPEIRRIGFNGRRAAELYRRQVLPLLDESAHELFDLPSTSPAHAAMPYAQKLEIWRSIICP